MTKLFKNFCNDESGATAIEYGLIAALIALAIMVGANALGNSLNTKFQDIADCVADPTSTGCGAPAA